MPAIAKARFNPRPAPQLIVWTLFAYVACLASVAALI